MELDKRLQRDLRAHVTGGERLGVLGLGVVEAVDVRLVVLAVVQLPSVLVFFFFQFPQLPQNKKKKKTHLHDLARDGGLKRAIVVRKVRQCVFAAAPGGHGGRRLNGSAEGGGGRACAEEGERHCDLLMKV